MARHSGGWIAGLCAAITTLAATTAAAQAPPKPHYLFAWTGAVGKDAQGRDGTDFLAVIDADPASATYGNLVTTAATDQVTFNAHHTEYVMPEGGRLFANDHNAGRTFLFDLNDPTRPKVVMSFHGLGGLTTPHSFVR